MSNCQDSPSRLQIAVIARCWHGLTVAAGWYTMPDDAAVMCRDYADWRGRGLRVSVLPGREGPVSVRRCQLCQDEDEQ